MLTAYLACIKKLTGNNMSIKKLHAWKQKQVIYFAEIRI